MVSNPTLIIGASAAGLAAAACLQKKGIPFVILEKEGSVGIKWRKHYDRLHLHTGRKESYLPFKPFDPKLPTYVSRDALIEYLEDYRATFGINPVYNTEVKNIRRHHGQWLVSTNQGVYLSNHLILATGLNHSPKTAEPAGLETFPGKTLHSSSYKNGQPYRGQKVLVVGFGNSACEQAIDLHEHGAYPSLSVRSEVNVLPRDVFGIPILQLSLLSRIFPYKIADKLNGPLLRFLVGDINKLGLRKAPYGPLEQIHTKRRIPLLDIGTLDLIRKGHIKVFGEIDHIEGKTIYFSDLKHQDFDAILFATGYHHDLEKILDIEPGILAELKKPMKDRKFNGQEGLYFCGYYVSPTGMLREIRLEAERIAEDISKRSCPQSS